jgi:hypothetical protein
MEYKNFYENVQEANLRLQGTIVLYDGEPMYVQAITDHKNDGVFRIYMTDLKTTSVGYNIPGLQNYPAGTAPLGVMMDTHVDGNAKIPNCTILRKKMDSKHFNKFRPFPLGMMNYKGAAYFLERRPNRPSTKQGLIPAAICIARITAGQEKAVKPHNIHFYSEEFRDCVVGDYPTPKECLAGLTPENINESAAFHRNFALVGGPIDTIFLAYKDEVVGALPRNDFSEVRLGRKFAHVREAIQELRLFTRIS